MSVLFSGTVYQEAHSEPFLAVQTGLKCSQCHVNKTGGGKRTDYGSIYTQTMLPSRFVATETNFDKNLNETIQTGLNLRLEASSALPKDDAEGRAGFSVPEGNVYVEMNLIQNLLTLYLDQRVSPEPSAREVFALFQHGESGAYVKAGKMLQPFGLRLYDDETYTRARTGFTYGTPALGLELGAEPGPASFSWMITDVRSSLVGYLLFNQVPVVQSIRVGASAYQGYGSLYNLGDASGPFWEDPGEFATGFGIFAGWKLWKLAWLGEADWQRVDVGGGMAWQQLGMVLVNYMPKKGWNLRLGFDWLNPNQDAEFSNNGESRIVYGLEWFPIQYLQLAAYYHQRQSRPDDASGNQDRIRMQVHAFY